MMLGKLLFKICLNFDNEAFLNTGKLFDKVANCIMRMKCILNNVKCLTQIRSDTLCVKHMVLIQIRSYQTAQHTHYITRRLLKWVLCFIWVLYYHIAYITSFSNLSYIVISLQYCAALVISV